MSLADRVMFGLPPGLIIPRGMRVAVWHRGGGSASAQPKQEETLFSPEYLQVTVEQLEYGTI